MEPLQSGIKQKRNIFEVALALAFPAGMRRGSMLQARQLVARFNELAGASLDPDNEMDRTQLEDIAERVGIVCGDFVFAKSALLSNAGREKLHNIIEGYFKLGAPAIYYEALFAVMQNDTSGAFIDSHINTIDILRAYIGAMFNQYGHWKLYLTPTVWGEKRDIKAHIADVLLQMGGGDAVKVEDLAKAMPYFTPDYIKSILNVDERFARVGGGEGKVFLADAVKLERGEKVAIREIIDCGIEESGSISSGDILERAQKKCPDLFERYTFLSSRIAFMGVLRVSLKGEYSFSRAVVSSLDRVIKGPQLFAQWAQENAPFTLEQLRSYADSLNIPAPMGVIVSTVLRVNKTEFIPRDSARFDIDAIDNVIASYCTGEYVTFKAFTSFGAFPTATFADGTRPWNVFLLESYAAGYSKRFRLLRVHYPAVDSCTGVILRKDAPFTKYDDVMADYLAHNSKITNKNDALLALQDAGFIAQLRYKYIDRVLEKAQAAP